jgi:hypothetical protein
LTQLVVLRVHWQWSGSLRGLCVLFPLKNVKSKNFHLHKIKRRSINHPKRNRNTRQITMAFLFMIDQHFFFLFIMSVPFGERKKIDRSFQPQVVVYIRTLAVPMCRSHLWGPNTALGNIQKRPESIGSLQESHHFNRIQLRGTLN